MMELSKPARETLIKDIKKMLRCEYSTDNGLTYIRGQSLSYMVTSLRDLGWKNVPSIHFFSDDLKALGFKVVRAREKRPWSNNPRACRQECNVVRE